MRNKRGNTRGEAMVIVICVMFVFVALSLSILLSASNLSQATLRDRVREQAYLSAVSFGGLITNELENSRVEAIYSGPDADYSMSVGSDTIVFNSTGMTNYYDSTGAQSNTAPLLSKLVYSRLRPYINFFGRHPTADENDISPLEYWFYDRDISSSEQLAAYVDLIRPTFTMDNVSDAGSAVVTLSWSPASESATLSDLNSFTTRSDGTNMYFEQDNIIVLTVKIVMTVSERSYTLSQDYQLKRTIKCVDYGVEHRYRALSEEWTWKFKERY